MSRYDNEADPESGLAIIIAQNEMQPRERLIWSDRPVAGTGWREALPRIGFGLLFSGFAVFWTVMAFGITRADGGMSEADPIAFYFPFFGLPFFLVGLGIVINALMTARRAGASVYALSDQRIAVISGGRRKHVRSFNLLDLGDVERVERGGGAGDILFRKEAVGRMNGRMITRRSGLRGVPDVRSVADEIDRARREAREEAQSG